MLFTKKIKELRIQNQMPQRQIAAALNIDTVTYISYSDYRELEDEINAFIENGGL